MECTDEDMMDYILMADEILLWSSELNIWIPIEKNKFRFVMQGPMRHLLSRLRVWDYRSTEKKLLLEITEE